MTTKTAQFTPGPWTVQRSTDTNKPAYIRGGDGESVANLYRLQPRVEANANLIAAAPAMYEALRDLVSYLQDHVADAVLNDWAPVLKAACALTQAEGRQ